MARKPPLGSGKRFGTLTRELEKKGHSEESAQRIAASIGREKYGDKKMQKIAATGARRAARGR